MKFTKTVRASKKVAPSAKRPVRASRRFIKSDEEIEDIEQFDEEIPAEDDIDVEEAPVEEEILFEAADVSNVKVINIPASDLSDDEYRPFLYKI